MNITLAITVVLALTCACIIRLDFALYLNKKKTMSTKFTNLCMWIGLVSLVLFAIEFVFHPLNIIL